MSNIYEELYKCRPIFRRCPARGPDVLCTVMASLTHPHPESEDGTVGSYIIRRNVFVDEPPHGAAVTLYVNY